ncbi:MAG: hypothetical protein ACKPKO_60000, partial [Candidatus Fonsibacter sp.]
YSDHRLIVRVVQTGKTPTMRYLGRTHRISVAWLHEVFRDPNLQLMYETSNNMCADIYTKGFTDTATWNGLLRAISSALLTLCACGSW